MSDMIPPTESTQTLTETQAQTPLERLYIFLLYLGYVAERLPVSPEVRFESLLVGLDRADHTEPEQAVEIVAQLFYSEDVVKDPELNDIRDELDASASLQFLVNLPISFAELAPERLMTGYQLLMHCSQMVPVGYFGINNDGQLYLSYALRASDQNIPVPLIIELLELMSFFCHQFRPVLEAVASSDKPLAALITELEQNLISAAQVVVADQDAQA